MRAHTQLGTAFVGSFTVAKQVVIFGIYNDMRAAL